MKLLFVCTGNTCRSAMAEYLLNAYALEMKLDIECSSSGIFAINGAPASGYAVEVLRNYGADASGHKSRLLSEEILSECDLVICMTGAHADCIAHKFKGTRVKIVSMREVTGLDVADPYGGDAASYKKTAEQIAENMTKIANFALKNVKK